MLLKRSISNLVAIMLIIIGAFTTFVLYKNNVLQNILQSFISVYSAPHDYTKKTLCIVAGSDSDLDTIPDIIKKNMKVIVFYKEVKDTCDSYIFMTYPKSYDYSIFQKRGIMFSQDVPSSEQTKFFNSYSTTYSSVSGEIDELTTNDFVNSIVGKEYSSDLQNVQCQIPSAEIQGKDFICLYGNFIIITDKYKDKFLNTFQDSLLRYLTYS
jgi:hypothetical protein